MGVPDTLSGTVIDLEFVTAPADGSMQTIVLLREATTIGPDTFRVACQLSPGLAAENVNLVALQASSAQPAGAQCLRNTDCTSGICTEGVCQ
jgi:hypothetical protein